MNAKASAFACRFTGCIGVIASLLFWKVYGPLGMIIGLIGSLFWFGLGRYVEKK
ncbi:hypothetical protein GXN76_02770 [Kroppenstedtia pulmonis]|uniref:Uncharacterized protein n=1 Tax=Kroppenstedtia pulmonis TaxID=1380685 RepID=A0A7D3XHW4_9BACL|nr:hypothetical protein [Kroppenstedtia pulmonis]QKG83499.1 hypothetical protein GXN76_02770 [Kroppenstedtia pulmonis]